MRLLFGLFVLLACSVSPAQVVRLEVVSDEGLPGKGSAFCVGATPDGNSVFVTAGHNFKKATKARVFHERQWYSVRSVNNYSGHDVSSFEVKMKCKSMRFASRGKRGSRVRLLGYGREANGYYTGGSEVDGVLLGGGSIVCNGQGAVPGDSGGPVIDSNDNVTGVIVGYDELKPEVSVYVGLRDIYECLTQVYQCPAEAQYGCPPGGCPIYVRPQVQQPMIGIGIPTGPPRVVGIAEPSPRRYIPEETPDVEYREGSQGPPGRDGKDGRSVTQPEVEAAVAAWLDSNADRLRGNDGRDGRDGEKGDRGDPGPGPSAEDLVAVVETVVARSPDRFRGPAGPVGSQGERGLVGVPDNVDVANWLKGALADADTRDMLRSELADLLATDPRVIDLLRRIESSAGASVEPIDMQILGNGGNVLGVARIARDGDRVVVESRTPEGVVVDKQFYAANDPVKLDLRSGR